MGAPHVLSITPWYHSAGLHYNILETSVHLLINFEHFDLLSLVLYQCHYKHQPMPRTAIKFTHASTAKSHRLAMNPLAYCALHVHSPQTHHAPIKAGQSTLYLGSLPLKQALLLNVRQKHVTLQHTHPTWMQAITTDSAAKARPVDQEANLGKDASSRPDRK